MSTPPVAPYAHTVNVLGRGIACEFVPLTLGQRHSTAGLIEIDFGLATLAAVRYGCIKIEDVAPAGAPDALGHRWTDAEVDALDKRFSAMALHRIGKAILERSHILPEVEKNSDGASG